VNFSKFLSINFEFAIRKWNVPISINFVVLKDWKLFAFCCQFFWMCNKKMECSNFCSKMQPKPPTIKRKIQEAKFKSNYKVITIFVRIHAPLIRECGKLIIVKKKKWSNFIFFPWYCVDALDVHFWPFICSSSKAFFCAIVFYPLHMDAFYLTYKFCNHWKMNS